eukprot:827684-Amphidinium_carterae.1
MYCVYVRRVVPTIEGFARTKPGGERIRHDQTIIVTKRANDGNEPEDRGKFAHKAYHELGTSIYFHSGNAFNSMN